MSTENIPILTYLSITKHPDGNVALDKERLRFLRIKFAQSYQGNDLDDDHLRRQTIEQLFENLHIKKDVMSLDYVDLAMRERSDSDAEFEILEKFRGSVQYLEPITSPEKKKSKNPPSSLNQIDETKVKLVNDIICIIHKKSPQSEINDFISDFLFQQVQTSAQSKYVPLYDGSVYPLPHGTILDLFIRQQMIDRGTITFMRPRSRFCLVEPISLTDEFDSWAFDHFHNLFDFWLTIDLTNKNHFPNQWKLHANAEIRYIIVDQLSDIDADQTSKNTGRPTTKSLESFLRGICRIEDNGKFSEWFKALVEDENIHTYSHLTNLNQKEWDRIEKLPMNALKTIKFYVDREKQTVEERKTKRNVDSNQRKEASYSKAEIRANLHMIKLYVIRQLEDQDGIETLPKLDAYCVEKALDEMREEGYEDDGLFDEMKLFFQPLTITDDELTIDSSLLIALNKEQLAEKRSLEDEITTLNDSLRQEENSLRQLNEQCDTAKEKRNQDYQQYKLDSSRNENRSYRKQLEADQSWAKKSDEWKEKINSVNRKITQHENKFKDIETDKMAKENLLKIIEQNLSADNSKIDNRLIKLHRGFIMYGPPGTGKSVIMSKLAKKIGIAMLGPPLAAGELERPLVGQSEAIILDLCMRGNRLPHLMCCVSIDEIDSLALKRDEDSSEGKVAKISVLLSVIEGIKDISNLMFFSATNRLNMMDEAFLRRMSGKFFVGRPSSDARKRILDGIPKVILQPNIKEKLSTATTNFSGAALKALTSAITVHYLAQKRLNNKYEIREEDALILADRTARQYQLFLGLNTLPRLLLHNLDNRRLLSHNANHGSRDSTEFHLPETYRFTGKIIISLHDKCVRTEVIQKNNRRHIIEDSLRETEENLQQLLERITSYGNDRNVQLLQLIDLNLLSSKGAYDEKKIFETLKERYDECMEYKRSMIVYDLDSLVGVNQSDSESSMGTSTSTSIVNQSIYIYVTSRFREAAIEASCTDKRQKNERWAIAVVRDPFLLKKFTTDVDFTFTNEQIEQDEEEHRRSTITLVCVKCRDLYVESDNKMGSCNYHDGFVYDNLARDLKKYKPSRAIEELNREEFISYTNPKKKEEIEKGKTRFKYICCYATVQVGAGFNGCKKGKHGFGNSRKKNFEGQILDKQMIDKWETACDENPEYNQQYADLFDSRKNI
ncbi:unnamed protein product [Rotaria magnacalcarata]